LKKGDFVWIGIFLVIALFIINPVSGAFYKVQNDLHPFILGFIKFCILATMGEMLSLRIVTGNWIVPKGILLRAIIWGLLGVAIVMAFKIYPTGIDSVVKKGYLPGASLHGLLGKILNAFYISTFINLTFALFLMGIHRITDTYIDIFYKHKQIPSFNEVLEDIKWKEFVSFVVFKTIPFFWIPAHTITFSLPSEYQVLMAALLSIALGSILGFAKRRTI
jgi:hypothetical protein